MAGRVTIIAGAGDVGGRVAALRDAAGDRVLCLRRHVDRAGPHGTALAADLCTGEGLDALPRSCDALVYCAAPDHRDEDSYRRLYVEGLRHVLAATTPRRLLFVSSTAVYAEDEGELVTERTRPRPPAFNGRVLLEAEQVAAGHPGAVVLRLTGLYGPGRESMVRRAQRGEAGRNHWTNRIHVDDAAAAISHLLHLAKPAPLYLGSDDEPALECEVVDWLRHRLHLDPLAARDDPESGRQISNALLRESGWEPAYPDFRAGYAPLLETAGV